MREVAGGERDDGSLSSPPAGDDTCEGDGGGGDRDRRPSGRYLAPGDANVRTVEQVAEKRARERLRVPHFGGHAGKTKGRHRSRSSASEFFAGLGSQLSKFTYNI